MLSINHLLIMLQRLQRLIQDCTSKAIVEKFHFISHSKSVLEIKRKKIALVQILSPRNENKYSNVPKNILETL